MVCPYAATLGRMPGSQPDDSARQLRRAFVDHQIDINDFLNKNGNGFLRTKEARHINKIQMYATASIVLEHIWAGIKCVPVKRLHVTLKIKYGSPVYEERALNFIKVHLGLLEALKQQFVDEAFARYKAREEKEEDRILICMFAVGKPRYKTLRAPRDLKQQLNVLAFPSMADLITIFGRIAHIAPTVFACDMGRPPTQEELFALLKHPYLLRLFIDMMTLDRPKLMPLLTRLEGTKRLDLNDAGRTFDPRFFSVSRVEDQYVLHLHPEFVAESRAQLMRAQRRRIKRGKPAPAMLGCPALYSGKFREMYEWVAQCFEHWCVVAI